METALVLCMLASGVSASPSIEANGDNVKIIGSTVSFSTDDGDMGLTQVFDLIKNFPQTQKDVTALNQSIKDLNSTLASDITAAIGRTDDAVSVLTDLINGLDTRLTTAEGVLSTNLTQLQNDLKLLDNYVQAIPLEAPTCDPVTLNNGKANVFGDHGGKIPVGVTVEFTCNDGYYLSGTSTSTCNSDSTWSSQVPQCMSCSSNCGMCTSSSKCTACASPNEYYLTGGSCTKGRLGYVQNRPAKSCLEIQTKYNDARSGVYWLVDQGAKKTRLFECDLKDNMQQQDGGGWTLVGNGIGGQVSCWMTSASGNCLNNNYPNTKSTFKFSDNTINGFLTTTIKFRSNGTKAANTAWYFSAASCKYSHATPSQRDCNCAHAKADFSDVCNPNNVAANGHNGVGDWGGGYGCLHSSQTRLPEHGWYMRKNGFTNCANFCRGWDQGCDVQLYVR